MEEDAAKAKLNLLTKEQLVRMVLEQGHSELDARVGELESELAGAEAKIAEQDKLLAAKPATATTGSPEQKFVQIAAGQPVGAGLCLFALDEDGQLWGTVFGRQEWTPLPSSGLLAFPS